MTPRGDAAAGYGAILNALQPDASPYVAGAGASPLDDVSCPFAIYGASPGAGGGLSSTPPTLFAELRRFLPEAHYCKPYAVAIGGALCRLNAPSILAFCSKRSRRYASR